MDLTLAGWILIPTLFIAGLHKGWRFLVLAALFFSPFSATAIVNITSIRFGLQPYHLCIFLAALFALISTVKDRRFTLNHGTGLVVGSQILLLGTVALSALANGLAIVLIAQLLHLAAGVALLFLALTSQLRPNQYIRAFIAGCVICVLIQLWQGSAFLFGFAFPYELTNSSVGEFSRGYSSLLAGDLIPRLTGPATEPSTLARDLTVALVLATWSAHAHQFAGRIATGLSIFLALGLVLSTSTAGIIGLGLVAITRLLLLPGRTAFTLQLVLACISASLAIYLYAPELLQAGYEVTFGKWAYGTAEDRFDSIRAAFAAFLSNPWLGSGLGSVTSHDLVIKLFSNVGLVGTTAYFVTILVFIHALMASYGKSTVADNLLLQGAAIAVVAHLALDAMAGFTYTYGGYWATLLCFFAIATTLTGHSRSDGSFPEGFSKRQLKNTP